MEQSFLQTLFDGKAELDYLLVWTMLGEAKHSAWFTDPGEAERYAIAKQDRNTWFGVGLSPADYGPSFRCKADQVSAIAGLWADLDVLDPAHIAKNLCPSKMAALDLLHRLPLVPTVVVDSGHGLQAYWLFKELWRFDTSDERQEARALEESWLETMRTYAADWAIDSVGDLARVLRMPGTMNYKTPGAPAPVKIIENSGPRYDPSEFEEFLRAPATQAQRELGEQSHTSKGLDGEYWVRKYCREAQPGNRHETGKKLATQLRAAGLSLADASLFMDQYAEHCENLGACDEPATEHMATILTWAYGLQNFDKTPAFPGNGETLTEPDYLQDAPLSYEAPPPVDKQSAEIPRIVISNRHLRDKTDDSIAALSAANCPPVLFVRSGGLTRIGEDEHGEPIIQAVTDYGLRHRMSRVADFVSLSERKDEEGEKRTVVLKVNPPLDIARDILAAGSWRFPPLVGVTEVPVMAADGTVTTEPGYNPATRLFYAPSPGLVVPAIPINPTNEQRRAALELIQEPFKDFPFMDYPLADGAKQTNASRTNALAMLLTAVLRPAIPGPVPLALVDKPQAGTGASLLAEVVSLVSTGRASAMLVAPKDEESWRKSITALLLQGRTVITIDNVEEHLQSPSLSAALTGTLWQDRILGRSEMVTLPQRATWIATGNNVRLGGDLPRRCYWIRLDAEQARPWQRTEFEHPHLLQWVSEHRGRMIGAILTLARAWFAAGGPPAKDLPVVGGFEDWATIIGGVLAHAELTDFLGNLNEMYEQADDDTPQWEAFLTAWHEKWAGQSLTVAEVAKELLVNEPLANALPDDLADGSQKDAKNFTRRLGKALSRHSGMHFSNKLYIKRDGTEKRSIRWKVSEK